MDNTHNSTTEPLCFSRLIINEDIFAYSLKKFSVQMYFDLCIRKTTCKNGDPDQCMTLRK